MGNDIKDIENFIESLNSLDGLNCPETYSSLYDSGFQDAVSAIRVFIKNKFPKPVIHNSEGLIQ